MKYLFKAKNCRLKINNLFIIFLFFPVLCFAQEKLSPYPAVIHIHSNISDGTSFPLRRIVSLAKDKGIKILVFSDSFLRRWEYGLPIFSNIFKVYIEENSVRRYGINNYLHDLKKIKNEFPDMLILEGVEVTPFYWWSGNPFKKNLFLNDWSKHLLVMGLKKPKDYENLPVVGNWHFFGLFSKSRYSPYHGPKQYRPYQDLINYVTQKGGLVFWAHPEITELASWGKFVSVNFFTPDYPDSLLLTSGYTGFGLNIFSIKSHNIILAGGKWDAVLSSYCKGKMANPVWVIGEADYRGSGKINAVQNIIFLPEFKEEEVYFALRNGRFYTRYYSENDIDIFLSDFRIEDSANIYAAKSGFSGDNIRIGDKPKLCIKGNYTLKPPETLKIEVIRNGQSIKEFQLHEEGLFDLEFQDDSPEILNRKNYYRLIFFAGRNIVLATNPIFVEVKKNE